MRLPNGYGSVTKLSGNRRRPYMIKKTEGYNDKGHPIIKIIGYTETRTEGLQMLADYNSDPYDIDAAKITTIEVIEKYKQSRKYIRLAETTRKTYETYIRRISPYYDIPYRDLNGGHMQQLIDNEGSYSTQGSFRNVLKNLDDFAIKNDIIVSGYAQTLYVDNVSVKRKSKIFSEEEIEELWKNSSIPGVQDVLIMIYTGFRVSGIFEMKVEDVNLEDETLQGGVKTAAGKDRIVPIHPKILPFIKEKIVNAPGEHLLYNDEFNYHNYHSFRKIFDDVMSRLKLEHVPHDARHTFRSRLDNAGANKTSIDLLMGHKSSDIGERVYTHKTLEQLRETIELLD